MDLLHPSVAGHLDTFATHDDPLLKRLEARAEKDDFPIIGPVAGGVLYQIALLMRAQNVFELGSGFGYSTLWFAKAVHANGGGHVYHTVWDEGLSQDARSYVDEAGFDEIVQFHVGEAVAALKQTEGPFDIIFNDINKDGYPASIPIIKEKLRPGGALIVDNVLWHGRIFDPDDQEPSTEGVRDVTRLLHDDPDFASSIIPLRDGLLLAVKRA